MTYYLKYLKYKSKYLELKNMIGGDYRGTEEVLDVLWEARKKVGKVFEVTREELKSNYSHYCWISGYGLGFFLYLLKDQLPLKGHNKVGKHAVWNMTLNNIGPRNKVDSISDSSLSFHYYKTTIDLSTTDGKKLDKGTHFDWSDKDDGWFYKKNEYECYKSTLIPIDFDALWKARNDVGKVFEVTRSEFTNYYSHYCWISGPDYGLGFFLYLLKKDKEPLNGHNKVGDYAVWDIKKNNIGQLNLVKTEINILVRNLDYRTTIDLPTTYQNIILKKDVTKFDWSHTDDCWVYYDESLGSYKAELIKRKANIKV